MNKGKDIIKNRHVKKILISSISEIFLIPIHSFYPSIERPLFGGFEKRFSHI